MPHLSKATIEKIQYYVYLLSGPRNGKIFYVGKGKGNRINSHLLGSLEESAKETEKIRAIREIQDKGLEVELTVLRHGLTEKEAFEIEAAIIDLISIDNLTNIFSGHHSNDRGKMRLGDIEIQYQAEKGEFDESAILIRINRLYRYDMSESELYEATRKHWKVGSRAKTVKIACAVYAGIIREVYFINRWVSSPAKTQPGRSMFIGEIASSNIRDKYLNKSVVHLWKHGSQNPIKYVG